MEKPVKSVGLAAKVKPLVFLKEVQTELKKVDWPKKDQATRLTLIVVGISVLTAVFLGGFDFFFTKLMALIIK